MKHLYDTRRTAFGCIFMLLLLFTQSGFAQDSDTPVELHTMFGNGYFKPQSPDVWSMMRYGNATIDHYTGTMGQSIPVYTYSDSNFSIPVSIDYSSTGFKPCAGSGPLGKDWYLNVGGAVTRTVHGIPDDAYRDVYRWKWHFNKYYNIPDYGPGDTDPNLQISGYAQIYFDNPTDMSLDYVYTGAAAQEYMPIWRDNTDTDWGYETEPDVFHFNFMGYSGSFILQPNQQVRVFNSNKPASEFQIEFLMDIKEPKTSSSFIITTADKTKYYFSERESADVECSFFSSSSDWTNFSWRLTKIVKANGATARFTYASLKGKSSTGTASIIVDHLTVTSYHEEITRYWQDENAFPAVSTTYNNSDVSYLTDITVDGRVNISFGYSPLTMTSPKLLNSIKVVNMYNQQVKSCICTYKTSIGQPTFLKSVYLSGEGTYKMDYFNETETFPEPNSLATDWFGYYRGSTFIDPRHHSSNPSQLADALLRARTTNFKSTCMGLLQKLQYPTGGYSTFTYEQNNYNMALDSSIPTPNQPTGGVRIAQVNNYTKDGTQTQCRKFIYQMEDGQSSGHLMQEPAIYFSYIINFSNVNMDRNIVTTANSIGYTKDSHIEYLRVLEETRKTPTDPLLSKIEYNFYSSYSNSPLAESEATEIYSLTSEVPSSKEWTLNFSSRNNGLNEGMLSAKSFTGGRLKSKIEYNSAGDTVKRETINYLGFNKEGEPDRIMVPVLLYGRTGTHDYRLYSIFQSETNTKTYDLTGNLTSENNTLTTVNELGRTKQIFSQDSKGDCLCREFYYHPTITTYPTERISYRADHIIAATKYQYAANANMYNLSRVLQAKIEPILSTDRLALNYSTEYTYDFYDSTGLPWEMTDKNGVTTCYVWGYGGQYLIAKIENLTYDEMSDQYGITNQAYSDALPQTTEKMLREIEGVSVTTYTYKPLVGITSITDPSGHSVYYEYYDDGRLHYIRDHKGKTLNSYDYHIVTDNQ